MVSKYHLGANSQKKGGYKMRDRVLGAIAGIMISLLVLVAIVEFNQQPTEFDKAVQHQLHIRGWTGYHIKDGRAIFDYPIFKL